MIGNLRIAVLTTLLACSNAPPDATVCVDGNACLCADGTGGTAQCAEDGSVAACACKPNECPAVLSFEYCDGLDNDCNGEIDEGEVCPDATVANTEAFTGGVYLRATTGACTITLQRLWPREAAVTTPSGNCNFGHYQFRRSDGRLFFLDGGGLHVINNDGIAAVATPPCNAQVTHFDFDGAGTLHYQCESSVYRAGGVRAAPNVRQLVGVLADSRMLVTVASPIADALSDYAVLDATGRELSRASIAGFATGGFALPDASSVAGNHAYVAYGRELPFHKREVVVLRLDERSQWQHVRRAEVPGLEASQLVASDGTVLVRGLDPDSKQKAQRIVAYAPDGTSRVVWREDDSTVQSQLGAELLVGN